MGDGEGLTLGGRFELLGTLGRGGMGVVYRARDRDAGGREVALKVLSASGAGDREDVRRELSRFAREAEVTAALRHPGIVNVHSVGEAGGRPFIAFELVEGARSLTAAAADLDVRGRARLVRDLARALGHAHARGVVHRDVKPDNVLVSVDGVVRVADFGVARAVNLERLTRTGAIVGTPWYMAPEQIAGEEIGPAADVWAAGVVLYEVLTGARPFDCDTLVGLAGAICAARYAPPQTLTPGLPAALVDIVTRALTVDQARRYANGEALAGALDAFLAGAAAPARGRRGRVVAVALGLTATALGLMIVARRAPPRPPSAAPEAAQITLALEPLPDQTLAETCVVRGRIPPDAAAVVVRVEGARPRPLAPGAAFAIDVALAPGENLLVVEAQDQASGAPVARHTLRIARYVAPPWFSAAPAARRAPWPLPTRLRFGDEPGTYVNETDGSVLLWVAPAGPFMGRHEVTVAQWRAYSRATGAEDPNGQRPADHPAFYVSQPMAEAYAAWAGLRLPTEREWDRAFGDRPFPWGTAEDPTRANLSDSLGGDGSGEDTTPVGAFPRGASPSGCQDLIGNVWEWVLSDEPLLLPGVGILRGGAWDTMELLPRGRRIEVVNTRALEIWGLRVCR